MRLRKVSALITWDCAEPEFLSSLLKCFRILWWKAGQATEQIQFPVDPKRKKKSVMLVCCS